MAVKPIPAGFHSVTPCLMAQGTTRLIEFLKQAFDAQELERYTRPDGTVMHAQVRIGDSIVMMGEAQGECKPMPAALCLYVEDADAVYREAVSAGGISKMEPADQFYGDRMSCITDPGGNMWWIATHKEDVPPDELRRRAEASCAKAGA